MFPPRSLFQHSNISVGATQVPSRVKYFGFPSGVFLALHVNIRPSWKGLLDTKTLANLYIASAVENKVL
jgi:hypothetical protein